MNEKRYTPGPIAARALDDGGMVISGHAAVFDTPYEIWDFSERVVRGAFKKTLGEADVAALWNHDPNVVLGRNKSGTLKLAEDDTGLFYEVKLPPTQAARDLYTSIERGDVYQSSFAFEIVKEEWDYPKKDEDGTPLRTIKEAKLYDISPVTYAASPTTDVDVARAYRSLAEAMGIEDTADSVSGLLALRDDGTTEEPSEAKPDDHSEAEPVDHSEDDTRKPDPVDFVIAI